MKIALNPPICVIVTSVLLKLLSSTGNSKLWMHSRAFSVRSTKNQDKFPQQKFCWSLFAVTSCLLIAFNATHSLAAPVSAAALSVEASPAQSPYWSAPSVGYKNSLGAIKEPTPSHGTVPLLYPWISSSKGDLVCAKTNWSANGKLLTITYMLNGTPVHVTVAIEYTGVNIVATIDADQPLISAVFLGDWLPGLEAKNIAVPYYSGEIGYSPVLSQYVSNWWDWHSTHATKLIKSEVQYLPRTDGSLNLLHEVMHVATSPDVDLVFPSPGNPQSPYMSKLAGRVVLDIWDAGFAGIQQGLLDLEDFGISDCVGIIHTWQHGGYDNELPLHYSANTELGGDDGLKAALDQGKSSGCLMGLHQNYIDYYPNYPFFNSSALALNTDGTRQNAWFNTGTGIQSFAAKPNWMVTNAKSQSPDIHSNLGTNADYLDVHSAASIFGYVDMDVKSPNAGMLSSWTLGNQALWNYERTTHGGPVFGEGLEHWYYSGQLDGVEAQLGAGSVKLNSDASLPLFVDFDLTQIHPLQVNHGMGYYERWTKSGTTAMTTAQLDAYRMQEIAFGHAPYVGNALWRNIAYTVTEQNLVSPVAKSYAMAIPASIQYKIGADWQPSSVAAQSGPFNQVKVEYSNALTVVANASTNTLSSNNVLLPQFGWVASGADVLAYTGLCGKVICDYSQTANSVFANARNQADLYSGSSVAAPSILKLAQVGGHIALTLDWSVHRPIGQASTYWVFVHFVDDAKVSTSNNGVVFGTDYQPEADTQEWHPGQTVTDGPHTIWVSPTVQDGTYSIRIGLYDPATNERAVLFGDDDGTKRYIVGHLTISGGKSQFHYTPLVLPSLVPDPRLNSTGTVLNFGSIQTDGMISFSLENGRWVVRPFPRYRNFTVLINTSLMPMPDLIEATDGDSSEVVPIQEGQFWRLPLNHSKAYSWPAN